MGTESFPWRTVVPERGENGTMLALSIVAWALFAAATAMLLRRSVRGSSPVRSPTTALY